MKAPVPGRRLHRGFMIAGLWIDRLPAVLGASAVPRRAHPPCHAVATVAGLADEDAPVRRTASVAGDAPAVVRLSPDEQRERTASTPAGRTSSSRHARAATASFGPLRS